jgi:hypothetical protein
MKTTDEMLQDEDMEEMARLYPDRFQPSDQDAELEQVVPPPMPSGPGRAGPPMPQAGAPAPQPMPQAPGQPAPAPGQPQTKSIGRFGIDPRVMDYLTYISNPSQARTMSAMAHDAAAGGRHSALLGASAGIARGLAQTGTLFGKAPSAEPYAHQMEGYQKDTDQLTQQMLAQGAARAQRGGAIDQRILDYLMPQKKGGGAGGTWKQVLGLDGKPTWKYLPNTPGSEYAAPLASTSGKMYQGFYPDKKTPAWVREKPDGTKEYMDRDPGTRAVESIDGNGNPITIIVPNVPTVGGPKGQRPSAAPQTGPGAPPSTLPPTTKAPQPGDTTAPEDQAAEGYPKAKKKENLAPVKVIEGGKRGTKFVEKKEGQFYEEPPEGPNPTQAWSAQEQQYRYLSGKRQLEDIRQLLHRNKSFIMPTDADKAILKSKIYQAAVDFAKAVDPATAAREGEVSAAQQYMLPFEQWAGMKYSKGEADKIIDQYLLDIEARAHQFGVAHNSWHPPLVQPRDARGMVAEPPSQQAPQPPQSNGRQHQEGDRKKMPDGEYEWDGSKWRHVR